MFKEKMSCTPSSQPITPGWEGDTMNCCSLQAPLILSTKSHFSLLPPSPPCMLAIMALCTMEGSHYILDNHYWSKKNFLICVTFVKLVLNFSDSIYISFSSTLLSHHTWDVSYKNLTSR